MHKKVNNKRADVHKLIQQALSDKLGKTSSNVDPNLILFQSIENTKNKLPHSKNKKPNKIASRVRNRHPSQEFLSRPDDKFLTKVAGKVTRLKLPERGSFNGSMLDLGDKYLCVYRPHEFAFKACFLNEKFDVLNFKHYPINLSVVADPRLLITPDNKVLLSYSSFEQNDYIAANIIMDLNVSQELFLGDRYRVSPKELHERQKNWMPFVCEDKIYFIASVNPHAVYEFDPDSNESAKKVYQTEWKNPWMIRRTLRGNTNAVQLQDGNYLTVFHTAMNKDGIIYYDNGAYIFEGKPPFNVLYCSKKTILPAEAAVEPHVRKADAIKCVFPMSLNIKNDKILITYGDNDSAVKVMETNLQNIMDTMVSLNNV